MAKTTWGPNDTVTSADLNALGADVNTRQVATLTTPRTGIYPFEMCQSTAFAAAAAPYQQRRPFRLGLKPTQFRVHFANRTQIGDAFITGGAGDISQLTCYVGKAAVDATTGEPNGNFAATPQTVMTATTLANGTELVTPWINSATLQLNPFELNLLSYGFLAGSGSPQVALSGGLSWQNSTPADAGVAAPTTALNRVANTAYLQVWIEYQHADALAKNILIVGNSLSGPSYLAGPPVIDNYGELGTYHQLWAIQNQCSAASIAVAGSYAAHYAPGNTRWNVYDTCAIAPVYDAIIYFAINTSDLAGGTGAAQTSIDAKNNAIAAIKRGKALYPNARHIVTDIPPRIAFTGTASNTNEYERVNNLNPWWHMMPVATEQCLDIDSLVTDWATGTAARLRKVFTTDDTHFSVRTHQNIAQELSSAVHR